MSPGRAKRPFASIPSPEKCPNAEIYKLIQKKKLEIRN
jgi:hypothetical protein